MKKNFFKKLSFVLALAMLISCIAPAAGVFAAAKPALNATTKYLQLSGISGPNEYDFNVKNKQKGWKYAWSSANENVATVDNVGLTTAVGVGSTKVTVKITKASKAVATLSATVIVKDNIKTVKISNAPAKALKIGVAYDFNRSFTTEAGSTTKTTSVTRWTVDKATATIDNSGIFTATEAGQYKVTAMSFQSSAKYEAWKTSKDASLVLATDEVTVTVAPTLTVAQKDLDTFTITSDSALTDVAKNLSVYTLVGSTEVFVTTLKPVTVSDDKKTVTVDSYVALTEGATYVVKYTGLDPLTFVASSSAAEKVAKVVVSTTEAVVNVSTPVSVKLFDANGVDITKPDLTNRVTLTSSSNRVYYDAANKAVVFFTKGDTTVVEATYHTYKYEAGKEVGNITGSGTVIGVDVASTVVGAVKAWTMVTAGNASFSDVKQVLTVGENTKVLYVQLNTKTGTTDGTVDNKAGMNVGGNKFEFESSDKTTLFIDNSTGVLYPIKAGTVTVVVKYNDKAIDVLTISVGAERKATNIVLGKTDVTLSNSVNVIDSDTVTVKVKDQYGDDFATGTIGFEKLLGSPSSNIASVVASGVKFDGTLSGVSVVKGAYYYKVTAQGLTSFVTVNVLEPTSTTASSYQLALGATEVDSKSTTDVPRPTISIDLFGYAGTKTSHPGVNGGYTVTVKNPDGDETTLTTPSYDLTTVVSGTTIAPIKNGVYTVTAKNASGVAVDVKYFTVVNTQKAPTYEIKSTVYTSASSDVNVVVKDCFKVSFDGTEQTNFTVGDYLGTVGGQLFIKTLKWTQVIGSQTIEHTITVNQYISK
ncbi:MAG TPA: hypothetical protein VN258_15085 [Mobilitalea sp.]|nr:hypothetical protein [Mobilitalea sp.]